MLAIYQTVGKITSSLDTLGSIRGQGHLKLVLTREKTELTGELTAFDPPADEAINQVLKLVDSASFSLRREFAPNIVRIEVTFTLTCECTVR